MADILIQGMEMPQDCPHCFAVALGFKPLEDSCTLYCRAIDKFEDVETIIIRDKPYDIVMRHSDIPNWCPLLTLPEGHGRLIDADALKENLRTVEFWNGSEQIVSEQDINDALTIVPAEGGSEDG